MKASYLLILVEVKANSDPLLLEATRAIRNTDSERKLLGQCSGGTITKQCGLEEVADPPSDNCQY